MEFMLKDPIKNLRIAEKSITLSQETSPGILIETSHGIMIKGTRVKKRRESIAWIFLKLSQVTFM